jgi:hypothetical protein
MAIQNLESKNFEVEQNTTFSFEVQYLADDGITPISLVGSTAKMQIRDTQGGSKIACTLTSPTGGITINGPLGTLTVKMTPTQTNKLFYPKSAYDIMLIDSNGNKMKLLKGFITLSRSVTV